MTRRAMEHSTERTARDYRALVWTIKSLADDAEFEPFVEALPAVLWGPSGRRYSYDDAIQKLMRQPELQLLLRIEGFLRSCSSGLLTPEASQHRQITCYKALWAIASLQPSTESSMHTKAIDFSRLVRYCQRASQDGVGSFSASARALLRYSTFCSVKSDLLLHLDSLAKCSAETASSSIPHTEVTELVTSTVSYLESLSPESVFPFPMSRKLERSLSHSKFDSASLSIIIPDLVQAIETFCLTTPYKIVFDYLRQSASLGTPPYRWHDTRDMIALDPLVPFSAIGDYLEGALRVSAYRPPPDNPSAARVQWSDLLMWKLFSFWKPDEPKPIPRGIIQYLNHRYRSATNLLLSGSIGTYLWSSFPITLSQGAVPDAQKALWCLAWITPRNLRYLPTVYEPVLQTAEAISDSSPLAFSNIIMIKSKLIASLAFHADSSSDAQGSPLRHPVLPLRTGISVPSEFAESQISSDLQRSDAFQQVLRARIAEAQIVLVAEFLDSCCPDFIPYKVTETLQCICAALGDPQAEIHPTHQTRLARSMRRMLSLDQEPAGELLSVVVESRMFDVYLQEGQPRIQTSRGSRSTSGHPWLEESSARAQVTSTLTKYMSFSQGNRTRIRAILAGLGALHKSDADA
ncbi:hypothetical protein C8R47DRAFT_1222064 [Mycena vitilis]|nr:hypothetical protein C8R47DRAFT_1222064 [Mycena vitilis]